MMGPGRKDDVREARQKKLRAHQCAPTGFDYLRMPSFSMTVR